MYKSIIPEIKSLAIDMVSNGYTHDDLHLFLTDEKKEKLQGLFDEFGDASVIEKISVCLRMELDKTTNDLRKLERANRMQLLYLKVWVAKVLIGTLAIGTVLIIVLLILTDAGNVSGHLKDISDIVRVLFGI